MSFEWYDRDAFQTCGLTIVDINDAARTPGALAQCVSDRKRFWVITRGTQDTVDRVRSFFLTNEHNDLKLIQEKTFVGIDVYLFETLR